MVVVGLEERTETERRQFFLLSRAVGEQPRPSSTISATKIWGEQSIAYHHRRSRKCPELSLLGSRTLVVTWGSRMPDRQTEAPEKELTLFAVRLALLEKALGRLGQFAFIWATAILLGRFFSSMSKRDFWFVTVIVFVEAIGIFFRSRELVEWTHQFAVYHHQPGDSGDNFKDCNSQRRRWHPADMPLLPWQQAVIPPKYAASLFQLRKTIVAVVGGALSITGLVLQNGTYYESDPGRKNIRYALNIFYGLEIAEFAVFLFEVAYLLLTSGRLRDKVLRDCGLEDNGDRGKKLVDHFFSISYSKSMKDGILEGLKVDLVSFAEELLLSDLRDEHIMGAWALQKFTDSKKFVEDTLWKIGGSQRTMEKIVDMLNWKEKSELPLRTAAAKILAKLVDKKQHALHVAAIPGSLVSITLLLYARVPPGDTTDNPSLQRLGLDILNKLVSDNDNCERIRRTRGLLTQVVKLTHIEDTRTAQDEVRKVVVRQSLRLMHSMAYIIGSTGKDLRDDMLSNDDTFASIRHILQLRDDSVNSVLAIRIFKQLAINKQADQRIPYLGELIELLFLIFLETQSPGQGQDSRTPNEPPQAELMKTSQEESFLPPKMEAGKALDEITSKNKDILVHIQKKDLLWMFNVSGDRNHESQKDVDNILGNLGLRG